MNGITSLAWKSEWVALGDAEGNVAIWEWRTRHFRPLPHSRSPIRKLRFAPGKNNMKLIVLHLEGVDVWDVKGKLIVALCFPYLIITEFFKVSSLFESNAT